MRAGCLLGRAFNLSVRVLQPAAPFRLAETRTIPLPLSHSAIPSLSLFTNYHSSSSNNNKGINHWSCRTKLICATAGSFLFFGLSFSPKVFCEQRKFSTATMSSLPSLKLYQYQTCPFCSKARAYMDYYGIGYEVVEVNPLTRSEMKFSEYKKVPFLISKDEVQVCS